MKFNKVYNVYLERYVNEGILGSVASAIPRTMGYIAKDIATAGLKDNLIGQAFSQVRQTQAGERTESRSKEDKIVEKVKSELTNDPSFINKKITFKDAAKSLNITVSYNELTNYRLSVVSRPNQEAIKDLISEKDLNSMSLYNNNARNIIRDKIKEVLTEFDKESKEDMGEDFKKVKVDENQVLMKIERKIKDVFKPGMDSRSMSDKLTWIYIIATIGGLSLSIER